MLHKNYSNGIIVIFSVVFWLGDFNYRLNNIETDVCKLLLAENDLQQTLACDQVDYLILT